MAGNFDTSGTQSMRTKITLSPGLKAYSVWMLFTLKDTVKSFVNEIPPHNKSQSNLFGIYLNVYTWADFSLHLFIFLLSLSTHHVRDCLMDSMCRNGLFSHPNYCRTPHNSSGLSVLRLRASSHCDGQLEILFILIQLSFPISPLDWSLKAKAAQIVPA